MTLVCDYKSMKKKESIEVKKMCDLQARVDVNSVRSFLFWLLLSLIGLFLQHERESRLPYFTLDVCSDAGRRRHIIADKDHASEYIDMSAHDLGKMLALPLASLRDCLQFSFGDLYITSNLY